MTNMTNLKAIALLSGRFSVMLIYFKSIMFLTELKNQMTEGQPENVRLQICL